MSQSRKAVSLSREDYDAVVAFAAVHATSAAQVVSRGVRALVAGEIALGETQTPNELGMATKRARGLVPLLLPRKPARLMSRDELDARCAARDSAVRRREAERRAMLAPSDAGLSAFVRMPVSHATGSLVDDQIERSAADGIARTDGQVLDAALSRMLDVLEVQVDAGALCAVCLETDLCRCNGHRKAVGR